MFPICEMCIEHVILKPVALVFFMAVKFMNICLLILVNQEEYLVHIQMHSITKFKYYKQTLDRYKKFGLLMRAVTIRTQLIYLFKCIDSNLTFHDLLYLHEYSEILLN